MRSGLLELHPLVEADSDMSTDSIVGGLVVGLIDNLASAYVSTAYRQAVPLILLVVIILLRPHGLVGRKEERAV